MVLPFNELDSQNELDLKVLVQSKNDFTSSAIFRRGFNSSTDKELFFKKVIKCGMDSFLILSMAREVNEARAKARNRERMEN